MSIRIIADSTADISEQYKSRIAVVPLTLSFGEEEYIDGITITKKEFYEKLEKGDVLPKTSQATPEAFRQVYSEITKNGDSAIVIAVSSKLSGTYQSACIAALDYPNIRVVDSLNVATGSGILVHYAADQAEKGVLLEELYEDLQQKVKHICTLASLDTLEYLQKGGRISRLAAFAGGMLNIKPVVTLSGGEVIVIGKARGSKKANNFLNEKAAETGIDFELPILLGYTGNSSTLLESYIEDSRHLWVGKLPSLEMLQICSVIGTHAGPGGVVVSYFSPEK